VSLCARRPACCISW
jgi:hypothetical protein